MDDRNDAFFMNEFKRRRGAKSVLALCFANAPETYHHWHVFSHGSDGVCLEFDKLRFEELLPQDERIKTGFVNYLTIAQAGSRALPTEDLPFVKRFAFKDEAEFRILFIDMNETKEFEPLEIPLSCISRVTLSPWLSKPLADTVKNAIRSLKGCANIKIYRSSLIDNETWKRIRQSGSEEAALVADATRMRFKNDARAVQAAANSPARAGNDRGRPRAGRRPSGSINRQDLAPSLP